MPPLDQEQIRMLLQVLCQTHEEELSCDECLARLAAWVENELAGKDQPEALRLVQSHLDICPECVEELGALREALRGLESD